MFRRVESQLALVGMSKKELSAKTGIRYNTLLLKLNGSSPLYLDEALAIRQAIGWEGTIDALYADAHTAEKAGLSGGVHKEAV